MFNYTLIGENDYIFDPVGTIFANRGINDIDKFMNLNSSVINHYSLLKNINVATNCLLNHISNNSKILLVVDPDADGYSSSAIIYQYLRLIDENINLEWILHDDKVHGLQGIKIPVDTKLVILPDSGSEDYEYHEKLHKLGVDIIVLDHHEAKKESEFAIVVNPQICDYPNLNFSGAGVVLKFCEALDEKLNVDYSDSFYDLVALGNIADSMLMTELETRYYAQEGLKEINNDFFNALLKKQEYSIGGKINITSIAFYIAPLINAMIRIGDFSDKVDMFKAFIEEKELVKYKPRGSDEILVPLVDDMARRCVNARAKQNRIRDKIVNEIDEYIQENNLLNNKTIFVGDITIEEKGLTGLVANVIASKYKRPTIILSNIDKNGFGKGSGRGYDRGGIENFKDKVYSTKLFDYTNGHQGAFGVKIHKDNFNKVNDEINKLLFDYDIEDNFTVDFEIKANNLSEDLIVTINELEDQWSKGFEEPYILIKNIPVNESDINLIGKNEDTISIFYNGIKYMIFKTNEDNFNKMLEKEYISVIGKGKLNTYKGITTPQILVEAFDIE